MNRKSMIIPTVSVTGLHEIPSDFFQEKAIAGLVVDIECLSGFNESGSGRHNSSQWLETMKARGIRICIAVSAKNQNHYQNILKDVPDGSVLIVPPKISKTSIMDGAGQMGLEISQVAVVANRIFGGITKANMLQIPAVLCRSTAQGNSGVPALERTLESLILAMSRYTVTRFLLQTFLTLEFIKFGTIGVVNTLNTILLTGLFINTFMLQYQIAYVCGYFLSTVISFILNTIFTFQDRVSFMKFIKFIFSCVPNLVISTVSLIVVVEWIGLTKNLATMIAAVVGLPVTFLCMKLFVYTGKGKKNKKKV